MTDNQYSSSCLWSHPVPILPLEFDPPLALNEEFRRSGSHALPDMLPSEEKVPSRPGSKVELEGSKRSVFELHEIHYTP